jgi:transcriptional regulator with XRE-family HTH domain
MAKGERAEILVQSVVARLRAAREEKGLSYRDLAKLSGITGGGIHQIESGEIRSPTMYALTCLAHALGLQIGNRIAEYETGADSRAG